MNLTFENLTTEGYVAFVLAIIFTIFAIAGFIIFARHRDLNKGVVLVIALVLPFFAVFCWAYLILNVIKYNTVMSLAISAGSAVGYVLLALCFALILNACLKNRGNKQPKENKDEEENVEESLKEEQEEVAIKTADEEQPKSPKLITLKKKLMLGNSTTKALEAPKEESESAEENVEEKIEEQNEDETQE